MLKTCATLIFPGCAKFGVVVVVVVVGGGVAVDVKVEEVVVEVVVVAEVMVVSKAIETGTYNLIDRPKTLTTSIKLVGKRDTMDKSWRNNTIFKNFF